MKPVSGDGVAVICGIPDLPALAFSKAPAPSESGPLFPDGHDEIAESAAVHIRGAIHAPL